MTAIPAVLRETFSWLFEGQLYVFDTTGLNDALDENPELAMDCLLPINESIYASVMETNGIEERKIARLEPPHLDRPILIIEILDGHKIVDGGHRLCRKFRDGERTIRAFMISEPIWRRFLVDPQSVIHIIGS